METRSAGAGRRALVIGAGSIGTRHARLLDQIGMSTRIVSRRDGVGDHQDIEQAIGEWNPDYVVLANETSARRASVSAILASSFAGQLLVEKPLGSVPPALFDADFETWIGYNLRFHPAAEALRNFLHDQQILTMQVRAGQYLPDWRPGRDYRQTASNAAGGGVLRDLSHELDLLEWLVGPCQRVVSLVEGLSSLELEVEDVAAALAQYERAPIVTFELNYLDRPARRSICVTTNDHTVECDLISGELIVDGTVLSNDRPDRDHTYLQMHEAIMQNATNSVCSLAEGTRVMNVIDAIEQSATTRSWVDI